MFSVGIFLIISSVVRFVYLRSFLSGKQGTGEPRQAHCQSELTFAEKRALKALIWACIEPCVGVMVGCSPNIRQFVRKVRGSVTGQAKLSGAQYQSPTGIFKNRSLELISDSTSAVESDKSRDKRPSVC
ncbi:hypothetical protein BFJ70_g14327 [Fusarium oxysporum]|nr:hypothetical protein BFJ65_g3587 [Fusarium oxysporum f. sp. cepae]RKK45467.1 hypothetical protein BFJ66_g9035 [Fusarium oxysporum f. sp. cepae]RKK53726.1 hypothetical protein BFJ67_g5062 [Fusarium oxysporum f. sp. cepae]RKL18456.1 hypothetical protein BFJ70_g14327 [Fusarium oxysporum]